MAREIGIRKEFYTVTVWRDDQGRLLREWWQVDGGPLEVPGLRLKIFHREDGPACIEREPETGVTTYESWWQEQRMHRVDGPALIQRDPKSGVVIHEAWFLHGQLHRERGPAAIYRDADTGEISRRRWARNGQRIPRAEQRAIMQQMSAEEQSQGALEI